MNNYKKDRVNILLFKIITISLFVFPYYFRVNSLNEIASIKLIFIITIITLLINNIKQINKVYFFIVSFLIIYISINNISINNNSIASNIRNISMIIIPIYLLSLDWKHDIETDRRLFESVLKIFNFFVIIIFIIGVIDPLINYKIMTTISNILNNKLSIIISRGTTREVYRYTSYLGHYLFTKDIFLYFYVLNISYFKYFKRGLLNINLVRIISLVGILLTGSKSGVILFVLMILLVNYKGNKIFNIVSNIIMVLFAYILGFFDTFLKRITSGSLTTGRSESWEMLSSYTLYNVQIFFGYGEYYIDMAINYIGNVDAVAAFEYPIRILMYKYGVVITIIIYGLIFIYPLIKFIKYKSYGTFMLFSILVVNVNTYNGLLVTPDNMIFFILVTKLLISSCKYERKIKIN